LFGKDNSFRWCVTNAVLCLPYDNGAIRNPTSEEIRQCNPRLGEFIAIAEPKLIVWMGLHANKAKEELIRQYRHYLDKFRNLYIPHPSWMMKQKDELTAIKASVLQIEAVMRTLGFGEK
jgi:uracil-DNA glycosylase family 4